ncbi:MAG: hypothetical protein Q4G46_11670 [Propionibacteriaceae bacterium]|nr:hypothetical protein [Propionibacteriaceae bacterium]
MNYPDTLTRVSDQAEDALVNLWDHYQLGEIDEENFVATASQILTTARTGAVGLADIALSAELTRLWGRPVLPLGMTFTAPDEAFTAEMITNPTVQRGLRTNAAAALGVVVRAAVFRAAQQATQWGMKEHGVTTWTRETNDEACPVCTGLADGTELSTDTPMYTHKGCNCTPRPTE